MALLKRQYRYLNQQVNLFSLQYETYSLQMHPKSPCTSAVAPRPKLSERRYALRLVIFPCQYFPVRRRSSNPLHHICRLTSLLLPSRISSAAVSIPFVPHILPCACMLLYLLLIFSAIPIIPEQKYTLRLAVVPCQYLPSLLTSFQSI